MILAFDVDGAPAGFARRFFTEALKREQIEVALDRIGLDVPSPDDVPSGRNVTASDVMPRVTVSK